MPALGPDFRGARQSALYRAHSEQAVLPTIGFFALFLFLQLLLPGLPTAAGLIATKLGSPIFTDVSQLFMAAMAFMIPTGLFVSWLINRTAQQHGGSMLMPELLRLPNLGWAGWIAVVFGFVIVMGCFAAVVRLASGDTTSMGEIEKLTAAMRGNPLAAFIMPLAIGVSAPLAEEFLFRGPLFVRLRQTVLGAVGTLVITSAVWAVIHVTQPWINIALIFFMGLVLGGLLLRFGSIWVPVACHCVWNLLTTIMLFNAPLPVPA
jgi:uncharacterized protein